MFKSVAVAGATGAVGRIIRELLYQRSFPAERFVFLASARSAGQTIEFGGESHPVQELTPDVFQDIDLCISSTPDDVARDFIPLAVKQGTVVIDESGAWRMHHEVPLVVPEVNGPAALDHQGIIASPNCSTTQMVVAMKPLYDAAGIRRVIVSTYQATSGAGVAGEQELIDGTRAVLDQTPFDRVALAHDIAFNLIPQIGSPKHAGYTSEEMKMVDETKKIFGDETLKVCPTCVRVPVTNCHSEMIVVETERKLSAADARAAFEDFDGITVVDDLSAGTYPMPNSCSGQDDVFVGRIREDLSCENGIAFWCVSDNLRKGAATNAVQIAEYLMGQSNNGEG